MNTRRAEADTQSSLVDHLSIRDASQSFWERRYGRSLSDFEEEEIANNIRQVFELLADWDRKAHTVESSAPDQDSAEVSMQGVEVKDDTD